LNGSDVAESILKSENQKEWIKLADRSASDTDTDSWRKTCREIVKKGNLAKV